MSKPPPPPAPAATVCPHSIDNNNDNNNDDMPLDTDACVQCGNTSSNTQIRCYECPAYICNNCHWCHDFGHIIRQCDRCQACYCKSCDEMDQCDDCGTIVCASCSTLLSCKFCGGGLCEDCATACGRCGIVLCHRDAKFAVDCDTCKLSYCLVCLASGAKDPCVRCGSRPSKRMEQLVHLRLKSIYKAFQQTQHTNEPRRRKKKAQVPPSTADLQAQSQAADDAAAALLAELEEEEQAAQTKMNNNKKKKKKKKERSKVKMKEDEEEEEDGEEEKPLETTIATPQPSLETKPAPQKTNTEDGLEQELSNLVALQDEDGIEQFLLALKGVPGKAVLRKTAKKALKRLRKPDEEKEEVVEIVEPTSFRAETPPLPIPPLQPHELLKIISHSSKGTTATGGHKARPGTHKYEYILHMAPTIVGWVIGKGGQRIRDMMEDSGARIWIDQDSMGPKEPRVVYVSGNHKSVDTALQMLQDLVERTPRSPSASKNNTPHVVEKMNVVVVDETTPALPVEDDEEEVVELDQPAAPRLKPRKLTPEASEVLTCDSRFVPLLIGRRGWTIKNIQDTSMARVNIDQSVTPRKITVFGTRQNVDTAMSMIRDVLAYPKAQLQELADSDVPSTEPAREPVTTPPPPVILQQSDAKSTISASSSLSSTPEPSMASSKTPSFPTPQYPMESMLKPPPVSPPAFPLIPPQAAPGFAMPQPHQPQQPPPPPPLSKPSSGHSPVALPRMSGLPPLEARRTPTRPTSVGGLWDSAAMMAPPSAMGDRSKSDGFHAMDFMRPLGWGQQQHQQMQQQQQTHSDSNLMDSLFGPTQEDKDANELLGAINGISLSEKDGLWGAGGDTPLFSDSLWTTHNKNNP